MHRAHRDLVQALTLSGQEGVRIRRLLGIPTWLAVVRRIPLPVVEPRTNIGKPFWLEAPRFPDDSLRANGGRMRLPDRGKGSVLALDAKYAKALFAMVSHCHVHMLAVTPEPKQGPIRVCERTRHMSPGIT